MRYVYTNIDDDDDDSGNDTHSAEKHWRAKEEWKKEERRPMKRA